MGITTKNINEMDERLAQTQIEKDQSFNFCTRNLFYIPTAAQTEKSVPKTRDRPIKAHSSA
jgi:hypothetical protein